MGVGVGVGLGVGLRVLAIHPRSAGPVPCAAVSGSPVSPSRRPAVPSSRRPAVPPSAPDARASTLAPRMVP